LAVVYAEELKDVAEQLLERPVRSKGEALDLLIEAARSASPEERVDLVCAILVRLPADLLRSWSAETGNPAPTKDKAVANIALAHFSDDFDHIPDDEDEVDEDEDEEEDDDEVDEHEDEVVEDEDEEGDAVVADEVDDDDDWVFAEDASFDFDPTLAATPLRDYQIETIRALAERAGPRTGRKFLVQIATGGGKTRVVNDWIWHHVRPSGHRVLWVTLNWELLRQAAGDLCRRFEEAPDVLGWLGGGVHRPDRIREEQGAQIVYSTIHTWRMRASKLRREQFDFIVIDEVHWGEGGELYDELHRRHGSQATFVCMTATPRKWSIDSYERVCHHGVGPTLT
jgi:hypothetical protein